jgi:hypothetical protein
MKRHFRRRLMRRTTIAAEGVAGAVGAETTVAAAAAQGGMRARRDSGRARYQIVRGRCVDCQRHWQEGGGRAIEIDEVAFEVAGCDGQLIGATHVGHPQRATQSTPPSKVRHSLRRAHGRCEVPGCRHSGWVDVHHIRFRSEGGTHELTNLCVLCSVHHSQVHTGRLIVTGRDPALRFFHADGRPYGARSLQQAARDDDGLAIRGLEQSRTRRDTAPVGTEPGSGPDTTLVDDAISAMTNLGFPARDAKAAVTSAARSSTPEATVVGLVQAALRHTKAPAGCREPGPVWSSAVGLAATYAPAPALS